MRILLTNDDGIRAPGIAAALKILVRLGEVRVVAPQTVQSASGHGITLTTPLMTEEVPIDDQTIGIAVEGRPADCVKLAISHLLPWKPDLVVSGINSGANVGINVIYSGTVAAAIESAFLGVPAIALSLLIHRDMPDYDHAADICLGVIRRILKVGLQPREVISVNVPALRAPAKPRGTLLVRQCTARWEDRYERRLDPRGRAYFWNALEFKLGDSEVDTDVAALRDGFVTVTPLHFDLTDRQAMQRMAGVAEH